MKKIEKLKLNEMQDFTAIEKNESSALKGGGYASTLEGWQTFMHAENFDNSFTTICGSGTRYLKDGKEYWTELRVQPNGGYYTGQFVLGSFQYYQGGTMTYLVDTTPFDGVTNYQSYYGSIFGDGDPYGSHNNVQYF